MASSLKSTIYGPQKFLSRVLIECNSVGKVQTIKKSLKSKIKRNIYKTVNK